MLRCRKKEMKSKRQKHAHTPAHTHILTNTLTYTSKENHKNAANDFGIVAAADVVVAAVSVAAYVKGLPKITATKEAQLTGLGYGKKRGKIHDSRGKGCQGLWQHIRLPLRRFLSLPSAGTHLTHTPLTLKRLYPLLQPSPHTFALCDPRSLPLTTRLHPPPDSL